jgi:hypothetical protein
MTVPDSIVNDLLLSTQAIFAGTEGLIIIVFGTVLGFYVLREILAFFPKRK